MSTKLKRLLKRKSKIDEPAGKPKQLMKHLRPGALHEILAKKRRTMLKDQGIGDSTVGKDLLFKDPTRRKRSLHQFSAPARVVMDSPPAHSTRLATSHMLYSHPSPNDVQVDSDFTPVHSRRTRRSLRRSLSDDEEFQNEDVANVEVENEEEPIIEQVDDEDFENEDVANMEVENEEEPIVQPNLDQNEMRKSTRIQIRQKKTQLENVEAEQEMAGIQSMDENIEGSENKELKKRGKTTLSKLAKRIDKLVEVEWNEKGQPIGQGSVWLSSHLGALVREVVPYTLTDWRKLSPIQHDLLWASIQSKFAIDKNWQKKWCFTEMNELWRASKSRLVTELNNKPNESERLKLKPDCIKSDVEWRAFVRQKTSKEWQIVRKKYQEIRKKQLPHTLSRRGYARTISDMEKENPGVRISRVKAFRKAHIKKNGDPVNSKAAQMIEKLDEVVREKPQSCTTTNTNEDALTILFGTDKPGRLLAQGKGVTKTKLAVIEQRDEKIAQLTQEQDAMKKQISQLLNLFKKHATLPYGFTQTSEGQQSYIPLVPSPNPSTRSVSPQFSEARSACYLLDWTGTGEIVAEGRWFSSDPAAMVHHIPLGPQAMKVWVDVATKPEAYLFRPSPEMLNIRDAKGSTVAWPADKVTMR